MYFHSPYASSLSMIPIHFFEINSFYEVEVEVEVLRGRSRTGYQSGLTYFVLSTSVILGCDFLTTHGVILDFKAGTFHTTTSTQESKLLL